MRVVSGVVARVLMFVLSLAVEQTAHAEEKITIAAADLKFALEGIVASFRRAHPSVQIETIYAASGKFGI
jgi:molybdate transport system substrate-binding protein